MNDKVVQIRTNALVAEYIYTRKLSNVRLLNVIIRSLTVIVPLLLITALFIAKSTQYEDVTNLAATIVSSVLLSLAIFSMIIQLDQKIESYLIGRRLNISVAKDALKNIETKDNKLEWFYNYLAEMDSKDQENIGKVPKKLEMEAYRHSLKTLFPGETDTVCSICMASPFVYRKGSCQVCGNTPKVIV